MGGYEVRNGMKRCIKCNQVKLIDESRIFVNYTAIDDIKKRYEETLYLVDSLKKQQHDLETSIITHSIELRTLEWVIDRLEMDNDNNKNN